MKTMIVGVVIYEDNIFLRNSISDLIASSSAFELRGAFENCDHVSLDMETLRPDVVLMDIEMSGTNGLQGLRIIKKYHPQVHVIMLTVFEDNDNVFDAIRAGASGYMLKKTTPDKISEAKM
jgi:DNA-binding NarL/FixJ family response regulator